jgi:hypothetical protein
VESTIAMKWSGIVSGNIKLSYIDRVHPDNFSWHILVDAIILNTTDGLVELLTTVRNLNK